jgi:hypothetical protein
MMLRGRNVPRAWCPQCGAEGEMVPSDHGEGQWCFECYAQPHAAGAALATQFCKGRWKNNAMLRPAEGETGLVRAGGIP